MEKQQYFPYGQTEMDYLRRKDAALGEVIDKLGRIERPVMPDLFQALVNSIVAQQISSKALETIWGRIEERFSPLTPAYLNTVPAEELQRCGISMRKAEYIKDVTALAADGMLDLAGLQNLSDEEVCRRLSALRGIGVWTAEMLLIFSMRRPNVLSYGDLAIQRGLRMIYHLKEITPKLFEKYRRRYAPYATTASLYLWAVAGGALPEMKDFAPSKKKLSKKSKPASAAD